MRDLSLSEKLLDWYDIHARELPWRVSPGQRLAGVTPDPYRVWLSEIMLQQTTVAAVAPYFHDFTKRWPTVSHLANAKDSDVMAAWAGLGYYARARNLLKCARVVYSEHGGKFPASHEQLLSLPGIGPYTSAAISAIAFDLPSPVMDGNIERVTSRLFAVEAPLPKSKPILFAHVADLTPTERPGDFAQAMMDLGATICTPRSPACGICPFQEHCEGRRQGIADSLPRKLPKKPKPTRNGSLYIARRNRDGAWLLQRRPPSGLLGNMLGWPSSEWSETTPAMRPPFAGDWRRVEGEVRHTFTHFHLRLEIFITRTDTPDLLDDLEWYPPPRFSPSHLPTVMRKAFDLIRGDEMWN